MSSGKQSEGFQASVDLSEGITEYQQRRGFDNRSDALRELVQVGLREQRNPIIWRLKDKVIDWASMMAVASLVVALIGAATDIFSIYDGAAISVTLLITACMLLAVFEFTRIVMGMNAVGVRVRELLGRVKA